MTEADIVYLGIIGINILGVLISCVLAALATSRGENLW